MTDEERVKEIEKLKADIEYLKLCYENILKTGIESLRWKIDNLDSAWQARDKEIWRYCSGWRDSVIELTRPSKIRSLIREVMELKND